MHERLDEPMRASTTTRFSRRQVLEGLAVAGAVAMLPTALARRPAAAQTVSLGTTYQASVKKALSEQIDLIEDLEHSRPTPTISRRLEL